MDTLSKEYNLIVYKIKLQENIEERKRIIKILQSYSIQRGIALKNKETLIMTQSLQEKYSKLEEESIELRKLFIQNQL
jgi:hypothetical protein